MLTEAHQRPGAKAFTLIGTAIPLTLT